MHKTSHYTQDSWGELMKILWYLTELETNRDGGRLLLEFCGLFLYCKQLDLKVNWQQWMLLVFVDISCYLCGGTGHISKNCPKKKGKSHQCFFFYLLSFILVLQVTVCKLLFLSLMQQTLNLMAIRTRMVFVHISFLFFKI